MMNIEQGKISDFQLFLLITGFIEGSILLTSFASNLVKHNTWLVILSGLIFIVPFVYIFAWLAKRFPGTNFAWINRMVYGTYLGTTISILYLGYFLLTLSFNIRDLGNFYTTFFMRDTPLEVFLIVFTFTCAYAVWNGIEVLARICPFIVGTVILFVISATLMLFTKMNFSNLLPLGELSFKNFLHGVQIITEIPFGELVVFLTIYFALHGNQHTATATLSGLLLGAALFMVISIRNTAILGDTEAFLLSPSYQVVRLINFGFLSRMDILFAAGYILGMFFKCSILFYGVVLLLSQLLCLRTYSPLIFPLGCVVIILAIIVYPSMGEHFKTSQNTGIMFTIPFVHIFPVLTMFIAKIRNLPKKG